MSKDFRFGAVVWGCLTYAVGTMAIGIGTLLFVLLVLEPDSGEAAATLLLSNLAFGFAVVASAIVGIAAGLVTGLKAKGRESLHVLVLMASAIFVSTVIQLLGRTALDRPAGEGLSLEWRVGSMIFTWGSALLGAILAKGIRLEREAKVHRAGLQPCERCEFPMEIGETVCPRCGHVA